jgi:hypothetical protein
MRNSEKKSFFPPIQFNENVSFLTTVEFVYSKVQGTLDLISLIGIVRYKRNNVELPPLLQTDVFQKNYFK